MNNPSISIIVPIYNVAPYLPQCIDSLLNQGSFSDYEVILVDDGSKDEGASICDAYQKKHPDRIHVIHKSNGGLSDARNAGLKQASGRYILFVDGDDYIVSGSLERIFRTAEALDFPDMLFLKACRVFPDGRLELLEQLPENETVYGVPKMQALQRIARMAKYPGSSCTKLTLRSLITENQIFFEKGRKSEDLDWTKQALFAADTYGVCNTDYYMYRQNRPGSISGTIGISNVRDLIYVVDKWVTEAENFSDAEAQAVLYSFAAYEYKVLLGVVCILNPEERKEFFPWLKAHKRLLKYRSDRQIRMIRVAVRIFGVEKTAEMLHWYLKHR